MDAGLACAPGSRPRGAGAAVLARRLQPAHLVLQAAERPAKGGLSFFLGGHLLSASHVLGGGVLSPALLGDEAPLAVGGCVHHCALRLVPLTASPGTKPRSLVG